MNHHSFCKCERCGERHNNGLEECIENLQYQLSVAKDDLATCEALSLKKSKTVEEQRSWPEQKEFCCDDAMDMKATIKRLEDERDKAIRDHIRCCETNNHNAGMYMECKQLLQENQIHLVHKECWCNPTVDNDCYAEPKTSLAKEKPVYMGEPFYVWLSKLSLYETKFTVEEQKEFLKAAFVAGANEERDRRKQDSEFSDWKDAECNAHQIIQKPT